MRRTVTCIEGTKWQENLLMRFSGMGGMLGNEPFVEHPILLDVRAGRFGLVPVPAAGTAATPAPLDTGHEPAAQP